MAGPVAVPVIVLVVMPAVRAGRTGIVIPGAVRVTVLARSLGVLAHRW
jgi:hypothetical protein